MFFEINNTVQCADKLSKKRFLIKQLVTKKFYESSPSLEKINKYYYFDKESFQVIEIKISNLEEYVKKNFSF